jgi:accessory gene regulator protein AgrB
VSASALKLGTRQPEDVEPDRERVRQARRRAVVLAVAAAIIGAVFAPPSVHLSWHFLRRLSNGLGAFDHYNTVATSVVLVTLWCFLIAGHAAWMAWRLRKTLARLSPRR